MHPTDETPRDKQFTYEIRKEERMKKNGEEPGLFPKEEMDSLKREDSTHKPKQGCPYRKDEVVSAWIKSMRLGLVEDALWWLYVMWEWLRLPEDYILKRLAIFAHEDAFGPEASLYAAAGIVCAKASRNDQNITFALTEYMCRATKFWEVPEGRERERLAANVEADLAKQVIRPIPPYALDAHTRRGRKQGPDNRFSGTDEGRMNMVETYEREGTLEP